MVKSYMKKPVIIQAAQVTNENIYHVALWCKGEVDDEEKSILIPSADMLTPPTYANVGEYVIRQGEGFAVLSEAGFNATYVEAE